MPQFWTQLLLGGLWSVFYSRSTPEVPKKCPKSIEEAPVMTQLFTADAAVSSCVISELVNDYF